MITALASALALAGLRPRLPGRHEKPDTDAEQAAEADHAAAWQREVINPGSPFSSDDLEELKAAYREAAARHVLPPAEFAPVPEPVTEAPPLDPLPAPVAWQDTPPRPGPAAWIPVTFRQPEPATITDLPAAPDRAALRAHVATILARPSARSPLAQFVDSVLAEPVHGVWSDTTGSFAAVLAHA